MKSNTGSPINTNEKYPIIENYLPVSNNQEGLSPEEKDELTPQIQNIKENLKFLNIEKHLPNLFDSSQGGIKKIIELYIFSNSKLNGERMRATNENQLLFKELNRAGIDSKMNAEEKKNLEIAKQNLLHQIKIKEESLKESKVTFETQRQELEKQVKQYECREKALEHRFREKDQQYNTLQEGLRKLQGKTNFKNSFEIIQKFEQNQMKKKTEEEKMTIDRSNYENLRQENTNLKKSLVCLYREIGGVLLLHQEKLQKIKNSKGKLEWLNIEAPESMNFYDEIKVQNLIEDIVKYKELLMNGELVSVSGDQKEAFSVGAFELIRTYKQVFEMQNRLVEGALFLYDDIYPTKETEKENLCDGVNSNQSEGESITNYIEEQTRYLNEKKKENEKREVYILRMKERIEGNKGV